MALIDQLRHKAIKEGQKQSVNMGSVNIGIRHDNNLVIAKFFDVEVIAKALGKSAAEGIDHSLDLRVCQNLVDGSLLHIQDLAPDGHDGLIKTISRHLGGPARGVSLHNKNLTFGGVPGLTVGQLPILVKRELLLCQKIGLGPLLCSSDFGRLLGAGNDCL